MSTFRLTLFHKRCCGIALLALLTACGDADKPAPEPAQTSTSTSADINFNDDIAADTLSAEANAEANAEIEAQMQAQKSAGADGQATTDEQPETFASEADLPIAGADDAENNTDNADEDTAASIDIRAEIEKKYAPKTVENLPPAPDNSAILAFVAKEPIDSFKTIKWTDLMPKDDIDALLNPPDYVIDIEDGSLEDQIASELRSQQKGPPQDRYQQALVSTSVIPEMNGKFIRMPGYIVPLEYNDEKHVTQFFIVPFFGACIHVPPPPPNQIIYVNYPKGLKLDSIRAAYWFRGMLGISLTKNDLGTAAYHLTLRDYELY